MEDLKVIRFKVKELLGSQKNTLNYTVLKKCCLMMWMRTLVQTSLDKGTSMVGMYTNYLDLCDASGLPGVSYRVFVVEFKELLGGQELQYFIKRKTAGLFVYGLRTCNVQSFFVQSCLSELDNEVSPADDGTYFESCCQDQFPPEAGMETKRVYVKSFTRKAPLLRYESEGQRVSV
jgi:hypothetical protein